MIVSITHYETMWKWLKQMIKRKLTFFWVFWRSQKIEQQNSGQRFDFNGKFYTVKHFFAWFNSIWFWLCSEQFSSYLKVIVRWSLSLYRTRVRRKKIIKNIVLFNYQRSQISENERKQREKRRRTPHNAYTQL